MSLANIINAYGYHPIPGQLNKFAKQVTVDDEVITELEITSDNLVDFIEDLGDEKDIAFKKIMTYARSASLQATMPVIDTEIPVINGVNVANILQSEYTELGITIPEDCKSTSNLLQ
ncbi:PREDICTED: uncharacterized protein LOC108364752 [Rhagoletis zephyria]|uniref:uncharacterized protein LOC108364752 n=1 Tax=Rhagoletis zephyria TaxID=28612 RepID=UPI0008113952|nr:PREDICTED: uncharacterized protein LOC108364752 [Rhagoletis zephyria]